MAEDTGNIHNEDPNIPLPSFERLMKSHEEVRFKSDWMRLYGKELGVDVAKWQKGYVLQSIIGDGSNFFAVGFPNVKLVILHQLYWEESVPEIPTAIKQELHAVQDNLKKRDFNSIEGFKSAKDKWNEFRDSVEKMVKEDAELSGAMEYVENTEVDQIIISKYIEFRKTFKL